MSGHLPALDQESLRLLRTLVKEIHAKNGSGVQLPKLVALARQVRVDGGVTVDFTASRELGEPMVVLRMPPQPAPCFSTLTPREREVAQLVAQGLSNKEIAARLHISLGTVKDHLHHILTKTSLPSRTAITAAMAGLR